MKFLNYSLFIITSMAFSLSLKAKVAVYEDRYLDQASEEIIAITEKAANRMQFNDVYEVVTPKKAAVAINPWNKFIAGGINPQTKKPIIIINPEWFLPLPEDQQLFLLGRNFSLFTQGMASTSTKIIPFIFLGISIVLVSLFFILSGTTKLSRYTKGVRFLIVLGLVGVCNAFFINPLSLRLTHYFAIQHDNNINEITAKIMGNKDAAIKALEALDTSIKNELKNGEPFWAPHQNLFASYAQNLEKRLA